MMSSAKASDVEASNAAAPRMIARMMFSPRFERRGR
jgi:hypothetical protein